MKGSKRLRKDRNDQWQLRVDLPPDPVSGRRRQRSRLFAGTARQADTELARMIAEVERDEVTPTDATLGQLIERWYDQTRDGLSPSTRLGYEWRIALIGPALGHLRLSKLTVEHLDRFYLALSRDGGRSGRGQAPATIRQTHAIIHRALEVGMRWGWVHRNVATHATVPRANAREIEAPPTQRLAEILVDAQAHPEPSFGPLVRLAAATGARRGELCGLRWPRVDFERLLVTFSVSIAQGPDGWVEKSTKTRKARTVQIDPRTAAVLDGHRRRQQEFCAAAGADWVADGYVFTADPTSPLPWNPDSITKAWRRLPSTEGVRFHDLRHWHASVLLDRGESAGVVARRHGHSKTSTTTDIYGHRMEGADARAALIIGGILDGM